MYSDVGERDGALVRPPVSLDANHGLLEHSQVAMEPLTRPVEAQAEPPRR